ncbi:MAG TPA: hypothetical protein VFC42_05820 [Methylomirabilota bacterium]|jgi:hypothetical protein|nr:hypothetical protein [Methylomirabilota bacterium]
MVTLLVVWRWARALAGETAGLAALVLAAVDPDLIARTATWSRRTRR